MENDVICISSEEDCDDQVPPRKFDKDKEVPWVSAKVNTLLKSEETIIINNKFIEKIKERNFSWIDTSRIGRIVTNKKSINGIIIERDSVNQALRTKNLEVSNGRKSLENSLIENKLISDISGKQDSSIEKSIENNTLNGHDKSKKVIEDDLKKNGESSISQNPIFRTGEVSILKRKEIINNDIVIDKVSSPAKRSKLTDNDEVLENNAKCTSPKPSSSQNSSLLVTGTTSSHSDGRNSPTPGCSWFPEVEKPKLVVKERKILYDDEFDLFTTFLETCQRRDTSDDMKKIVKKLKKRHERLHPSFVNSDRFKQLLIDKQRMIESNEGTLFVHIQEVNDEIKNGGRRSRSLEKNAQKTVSDDCNEEKNDEAKKEVKGNENRDKKEERRIRKKLNSILNSMEVCKKRIKQLDEEEVDLDDDHDSSYLMKDRYEKKLIQLWLHFCKYSGEKTDAGRVYLRPKHISATLIPQVDQAIMSFINAKISRRNELMAKGKPISDTVIFPDYVDILNCISECNERKNLGLSKTVQEVKAKEAFVKIGEHLQRVRQSDFWDTFSLFLEEEDDDPALKDSDLAEKLGRNALEGKKKMNNLFEEYTKKQETRAAELNENEEIDEDEAEDGEDEKEEEQDEDDEEEKQDDEEDEEEEGEEEKKENDKVDDDFNEKNDVDHDNHEMSPINETKDSNVNTSSLNTETKIQDSTTPKSKDHSSTEKGSLPSNSSSEAKDSSLGDTDVIEIDERSSNADKQPILRLRSFAKPPTSWEDSLQTDCSPVIRKFTTSTPKSIVSKASAAFVDLTFEKGDTPLMKPVRRPLDPATLAAMKSKFKAVVIPSNFKGKQIISVKNITNNYNVVNGSGNAGLKPPRVVTSVSHKAPDGSQTIIRIPSQSSSHLKPRNPPQMRISEKMIRKINDKSSSTSIPILPKTSGNRQVYYQPTGNPNVFTNPEGKMVRVKSIVPNPEAKVIKVLNMNETQKLQIAPMQKHRVAHKVLTNQGKPNQGKPNQGNDQVNPKQVLVVPRIDHQYSKRIVTNIVRIMKPGEQNQQNLIPGRSIKKI